MPFNKQFPGGKAALLSTLIALPLLTACVIPIPFIYTPANAQTSANNSEMSTATVKRVDDKRRKLLLQHGPIANLGMSAMTMGFDVAPDVDMSGLAAGDSILFRAEEIKGNYTVTQIRKP